MQQTLIRLTYSGFALFLWFSGSSQDIRNVSWGMSQNEIKQVESLKLFYEICSSDDNCVLVYRDNILGDSAYVWYQFLFDSLSSIKYQFYLSSTSPDSYSTMLKYVNALTKKYGNPAQVDWNCNDSKTKYYIEKANDKDYEFVYNFWDGSIKEITYQWEADNTAIFLSVTPTDPMQGNKIVFPLIQINYISPLYYRLIGKVSGNKYNKL